MPAKVDSVAIVGFGLIGASLARALRSHAPDTALHAVDLPSVADDPAARQLVDTFTRSDNATAVTELLADSAVTVLAGPVSVIESQLPEALTFARVVTDCGSTKRRIHAAAAAHPRRARFVGGHPMAGRTLSGFAAAQSDLFQGKPWILCPEGADSEALDAVHWLVETVGAQAVNMSAEHHDRAVALTSHVPKLLAALLVRLADERGARVAAGPAFGRATHVAGGDVGIWRDILGSNADEVAGAAEDLAQALLEAAQQLRTGDVAATMALLESSRTR